VGIEVEPSTLVELLRSRAVQHPERRLFTFLADGDSQEIHMSYGELDRQARAVGALLQGMGFTGKRALVLYPPGLELLTASWGCQYAGMVLVYTYPPDPSRLVETLPQFLAIAKDSQASVVLTTSAMLAMAEPLFQIAPELKTLQWIATDNIPPDAEKSWKQPDHSPKDLAFLQYTSGSTGRPKGVMFSHKNILHQLKAACQVTELSPKSTIVSWVPLYHNLGIGMVTQAIIAESSLVLMSPLSFLQRPLSWLQAISRYKATFSLGPNFAYELCAQQIKPEEKVALDLSNWEMAICGAEPIRPETLDRFVTAFSPCGFRREAFTPAYGLTEATLTVSSSLKRVSPLIKNFQKEALQQNRVIEVSPGENGNQPVMACGPPLPNQKTLIVHPDSLTPCEPNEVGEIWISSPGVALGYWNLPEETEITFKAYLSNTGEGPFLRTGDLGFLKDGELFVTGRIKELIIIRGRNHYPQDIEQTVQKSHPALRVGCGAAFSIDIHNEERLVLVQEVDLLESLNTDQVMRRIREDVSKTHGIQVDTIVLLKPENIPKTRNNKIQRHACKVQFLNGGLDRISEWRGMSASKEEQKALTEITTPSQFATDIEKWLVLNISKRLKIQTSEIDITEPLTGYGLDSLSAVGLVSDIERECGIAIPIANLFESPSIQIIIERLKTEFKNSSKGVCISTLEPDLNADAVLDPSISFKSQPPETLREPTAIFLTGATGFVGVFLLEELLKKTQAKIYCLVRAPSEEEGRKNIRNNLDFFSLWKENFDSRIIPVIGDLSKKYFGLSESRFAGLANQIDAIYHCGALVNFVYSYRDLRAANILGTQEVLRLAAQGKCRALHHVSTFGVFPFAGHPEGKKYLESDRLVDNHGLLTAYSQSKWVAEKLVGDASSKGLPVTIYRVGEVIGHSRTGMCVATKNAYSLTVKGCVLLGLVPDLHLPIHLVPIDYVVRAITYLSRQKISIGKTFHLTNPNPLSLSSMYNFIDSLGYSLKRIPYKEWLQEVLEILETNQSNPLAFFIPLLQSKVVQQLDHQKYGLLMDCNNVLEGLAGSSIDCPKTNSELLLPYFSYLIRAGFLPPPDARVVKNA
jgi:thioester reductase-like protein